MIFSKAKVHIDESIPYLLNVKILNLYTLDLQYLDV